MAHHVSEQDNYVQIFEMTPDRRRKLAAAAQALIDLLDDIDGDPDLEDGGDDELTGDEREPSLGSVERHPNPYPCLGDGSQDQWANSADDDTEDEHDGCEPDTDGEPDLGSTTAMNQNHAWAGHRDYWGVVDSEPTLGWPEDRGGYGHPQFAPRGYDDEREENIGRDELEGLDYGMPTDNGIGDSGGLAEAEAGCL